MTPDRELTKEELQKLINEAAEGEIGLHALEVFMKEKTKPTLHDLCIGELYARLEGQTRIIIQLGRDLELFREELKRIIEREKLKKEAQPLREKAQP